MGWTHIYINLFCFTNSVCYGLNCLPERFVEVPTSSTCECDLIWKYGLSGCNQVKMRSSGQAIIQCKWCPCNKRERSCEEANGEGECPVATQAASGVARLTAAVRSWERRWRAFPYKFQGEKALANTLHLDF